MFTLLFLKLKGKQVNAINICNVYNNKEYSEIKNKILTFQYKMNKGY